MHKNILIRSIIKVFSKISQEESHEDLGSSSDNDKEVTRMPETDDGTQQPSSEQ